MSLFDIYKAKKLDAGIKLEDVLGEKYGIVDLGTLNWSKESTGIFYTNASSLGIVKISSSMTSTKGKGISSKYTLISVNDIQLAQGGIAWYHYSGNNTTYLYVGDTAFADAKTAKAGLSGVYLVYELDAPNGD